MQNNNMITQKDIAKEQLNNRILFDHKNGDQFKFYFVALLEIACELNLIDSVRSKKISALILETAQDFAEDDNYTAFKYYLYALSVWFNTMSNYDVFELLLAINSPADAKQLFNQAISYIKVKIADMKKTLNETEMLVANIQNKQLTHDFKILKNYVENLNNSNYAIYDLHNNSSFISYEFLRPISDFFKGDFVSSLEYTISCFYIELSILNKFDAKSLFKKMQKEYHPNCNSLDVLTRNYENELKKLKEEYESKLDEYYDLQAKLDSIMDEAEKNFTEQHPELSGDELEDALDEYFNDFDCGIEIIDETEIRNWYLNSKESVTSKFQKESKKIEKIHDDEMFRLNSSCSLLSVLKEFALFIQANEGLIIYPSDVKSKQELLMRLDTKYVIEVFLHNNEKKLELTNTEIDYLISLL